MANLILTNNCNLNCPFCFAVENNYGIKKTKEEFNVADLWKMIGFLKGRTVRLCGGEPTINSNINEIFDCLLKNEFNIVIMTNGLWNQKFKSYIKNLHTNDILKINYLFNVLEEDQYTQEQRNNLKEVLNIVNPINTTLGITIYKSDFNYKYLIDYCEEYSVKNIRISIAAPNISEGEYELEKDYYKIADRLYEFLKECSSRNIKVQKDCNYIAPCFFTKEQLLDIKYTINSSWNFTCASSPIDIDVNGNTWRCYGLYSILHSNIKNFNKEDELKDYFNRRMRLLSTNFYSYTECKNCEYWQKSCLGGCFTIRIKKALEQNPDLKIIPIDDDDEILNCKPKINKSVVLKKNNIQLIILKENEALSCDDTKVIEFLETIDGNLTINRLIEILRENFRSYEEAKKEIVLICRSLFERDIIDIVYSYNIELSNRPKKEECYKLEI